MRLQCDGTNTGYLDAPVIVRCAALHCAVRRSCTRVPGRYCYITAQDRTSRTRRGGCRTFRGSAALPCPAQHQLEGRGCRLEPGAFVVSGVSKQSTYVSSCRRSRLQCRGGAWSRVDGTDER
ncbi:hypothetical protein VFPFJ_04257 [Purpureocillium lilacinum]|uniref:Uncharacterized protein n=1 Tax=Purpureocillium lilacinum TaxID=33203 RepID=A0A179HPZ7_PURLI|nr:hypothetical protein VFPFJ_04257 [Purpureocillium lilacinum]OAQ92516.1 hypothetical protein VFPFJ_04257 [Purpureocillium lilacinum]